MIWDCASALPACLSCHPIANSTVSEVGTPEQRAGSREALALAVSADVHLVSTVHSAGWMILHGAHSVSALRVLLFSSGWPADPRRRLAALCRMVPYGSHCATLSNGCRIKGMPQSTGCEEEGRVGSPEALIKGPNSLVQ